MKSILTITLPVPKSNRCRFKAHRFGSPQYATLSLDERGRRSKTAKTTFIVMSCKDERCCATRLAR